MTHVVSPFGVAFSERVMIFIDGPNFYNSVKRTEKDFDWKLLIQHFETDDVCKYVRTNYFTAVASDANDYAPAMKLVDWLSFNGFVMHTKPAQEFTNREGQRRVKNSMDMEIAIAMLKAAYGGKVDHILLFSGDGDFAPLVAAVQDCGVRVTIISEDTQVSEDLRRQADRYVSITSNDMVAMFGKTRAAR
jgi:uncharacterized LabA/DUF88 family protein